MPLFDAAVAVVRAEPAAFPITHAVGVVITSSEPLPDTWREHGYSVPTAIIEVLVDARLLDHEGVRDWTREEVGREVGGYSVRLEDSHVAARWNGPIPLDERV